MLLYITMSSESKPEETKVEDTSGVDLSGVDLSGAVVDASGSVVEPPVAKKDMLLADIIAEYLATEEKEIPLSPRVLHMLNRMLQIDTSHLENIEKLYTKIMADRKIDVKDTGDIIKLIKEVYQFFRQTFVRKVSPEDCGILIKIVIFLLVTYRLDEDPETKEAIQNEELFEILDEVVATCVGLIEFKENIPRGLFRSFLVCF